MTILPRSLTAYRGGALLMALTLLKSGHTSWKASLVPMAGYGRAVALEAASSSASSWRVQLGQVYTEMCGGNDGAANSSGLRFFFTRKKKRKKKKKVTSLAHPLSIMSEPVSE